MKVLGKQTKETEPFWYSVYHSAYSISHTFSPQWLMPLWKEAEMAVARLHGKVKCGPFKEKGKEGTTYKAWHHWRSSLCYMFSYCSTFFLLSVLLLQFWGDQTNFCSFLLSFLPGNRLQCLTLSKGLDLFEWALWTSDLMVRQMCFYSVMQ